MNIETKAIDIHIHDLILGVVAEANELRGYLRGIKKTLSFVDERMNDFELELRVV